MSKSTIRMSVITVGALALGLAMFWQIATSGGADQKDAQGPACAVKNCCCPADAAACPVGCMGTACTCPAKANAEACCPADRDPATCPCPAMTNAAASCPAATPANVNTAGEAACPLENQAIMAAQSAVPESPSRAKVPAPSLQDLYARNLPGALQAIQQAQLAIQAGHQDEALKYLGQARASLLAAQLTLAAHVKPTYINASCPMMGSKIDPAKVTPQLTRHFNGQNVGFCCAGCPQAWDKLSPAEKEAKLKKVLSVTQQETPAAPKAAAGAS